MNLGIVAADQASFICESKSEMTPDVIILESKWVDQVFPGLLTVCVTAKCFLMTRHILINLMSSSFFSRIALFTSVRNSIFSVSTTLLDSYTSRYKQAVKKQTKKNL